MNHNNMYYAQGIQEKGVGEARPPCVPLRTTTPENSSQRAWYSPAMAAYKDQDTQGTRHKAPGEGRRGESVSAGVSPVELVD